MYRLRYPVVSGVERELRELEGGGGHIFIMETVSRSGRRSWNLGFLCGTGKQDERFTKEVNQ